MKTIDLNNCATGHYKDVLFLNAPCDCNEGYVVTYPDRQEFDLTVKKEGYIRSLICGAYGNWIKKYEAERLDIRIAILEMQVQGLINKDGK